MGMYSKLTPEAMEAYRATVRQRGENAQRERAKRRERAWNTAERAAVLLKEKFGAVQVAVFGSLVHGSPRSFTVSSNSKMSGRIFSSNSN